MNNKEFLESYKETAERLNGMVSNIVNLVLRIGKMSGWSILVSVMVHDFYNIKLDMKISERILFNSEVKRLNKFYSDLKKIFAETVRCKEIAKKKIPDEHHDEFVISLSIDKYNELDNFIEMTDESLRAWLELPQYNL